MECSAPFRSKAKVGCFYDAKKVCVGFQVRNLHAEPRPDWIEKEKELALTMPWAELPAPRGAAALLTTQASRDPSHPVRCALVDQAPLLLILIPLTHAADGG